jgi:hypothetical protein
LLTHWRCAAGLAALFAASAAAAVGPALETTRGTRLGKRCDYSGSVSATPAGKGTAARSVFQDPATCTLILLVGPSAVVDPKVTARTTLAFAVGTVARIGPDSLAVGPIECNAGVLKPLLTRFIVGEAVSLSCRNDAISSTAKVPAYASPYAGARGPLTRIGGGRLTLGVLSCRVGTSSPSTAAYHTGDAVDVECAGGTLDSITPVSRTSP